MGEANALQQDASARHGIEVGGMVIDLVRCSCDVPRLGRVQSAPHAVCCS